MNARERAADEFLDRIKSLAVWKAREKRAPHKPLLLLMALGRASRREPRKIPYREAGPQLK